MQKYSKKQRVFVYPTQDRPDNFRWIKTLTSFYLDVSFLIQQLVWHRYFYAAEARTKARNIFIYARTWQVLIVQIFIRSSYSEKISTKRKLRSGWIAVELLGSKFRSRLGICSGCEPCSALGMSSLMFSKLIFAIPIAISNHLI